MKFDKLPDGLQYLVPETDLDKCILKNFLMLFMRLEHEQFKDRKGSVAFNLRDDGIITALLFDNIIPPNSEGIEFREI